MEKINVKVANGTAVLTAVQHNSGLASVIPTGESLHLHQQWINAVLHTVSSNDICAFLM